MCCSARSYADSARSKSPICSATEPDWPAHKIQMIAKMKVRKKSSIQSESDSSRRHAPIRSHVSSFAFDSFCSVGCTAAALGTGGPPFACGGPGGPAGAAMGDSPIGAPCAWLWPIACPWPCPFESGVFGTLPLRSTVWGGGGPLVLGGGPAVGGPGGGGGAWGSCSLTSRSRAGWRNDMD